MNSTDAPKGADMARVDTIGRLAKELAYRSNDGIEVWLLWNKAEARLFVVLVDSKGGDSFEITVASDYALDAFHHPYAYAAWFEVEYTAPRRQTEPAYA